MANIAVFNTNTNVVLQYLESVSLPDYAGRSDVLISPNLSQVAGLPIRYWKHSVGALVSMTTQEKAAVDAAIAALALADERDGGIASFASQDAQGAILRAVGAVLVDEINTVRQWTVSFKAEVAASTTLANLQTRVSGLPTLVDRTLAQAKTAITNKINSDAVDQ